MTVVPSTVTGMFDLATDLLGATASAMATTAGGAPDVSYITLGEPAWGEACGQAVVQAGAITEGQTNAGNTSLGPGIRYVRGRVNLIAMVAYAMRCLSITEENSQIYSIPSGTTLTAIGKQGYEDGWAIWNWITRAARDGALFNGPCSLVFFDGSPVIAPEANLGGWRFVCRVELDGYDPT